MKGKDSTVQYKVALKIVILNFIDIYKKNKIPNCLQYAMNNKNDKYKVYLCSDPSLQS